MTAETRAAWLRGRVPGTAAPDGVLSSPSLADSRACGPAASKSGPSQRQGAVGQRAQDGQHPPCGHGDLDGHTRPPGSCQGEGPGGPIERRWWVPLPSGAALPPHSPAHWGEGRVRAAASDSRRASWRPRWEVPIFPGQEGGSTALPLSLRPKTPNSHVVLAVSGTN